MILEHDAFMDEDLSVHVLPATRELEAKQSRWRRALQQLTTHVPVRDWTPSLAAAEAASMATPTPTEVVVIDE